jgi:predicted transposase YdaD
MEKGMEKGRAELLKNLLESGLPIEEISRLTKIDIQEIARLTGVNQ